MSRHAEPQALLGPTTSRTPLNQQYEDIKCELGTKITVRINAAENKENNNGAVTRIKIKLTACYVYWS